MIDSLKILGLVIVGLSLLIILKNLIDLSKKYTESLENQNLKFALNQVIDLADTIVSSLNQTIVEPLKNSDKVEFNKKAQKEVLEKAKAKIKDNLDNKSKELLKAYLGSSIKFDAYLEDTIESKVYEKKR